MLIPPRLLHAHGCASDDPQRQVLQSVHLSRVRGKPHVSATSGKTLVDATWDEPDADEYPVPPGHDDFTPRPSCEDGFSAVIPAEDAKALCKWKSRFPKPILNHVAIDERANVMLKSVTTDLNTTSARDIRTIDGTFPDVSVLTDKHFTVVAKLDVHVLKTAVDTLYRMLGGKAGCKGVMAEMRMDTDGCSTTRQPIEFRTKDDGITIRAFVMPLVESEKR